MQVMNILAVNLLFSTLVFWIAARIYVVPRLNELRWQAVAHNEGTIRTVSKTWAPFMSS